MYQKLYKYLVLNKRIFFPGIGSFFIEEIPSSIDDGTQIIKPSQQTIYFLDEDDDKFQSDKLLFSFLAKENNKPETECKDEFNNFIEQLKTSLNSNNDVVLPQIGILKKSSIHEGFTFFPQHKNLKNIFPLITLSKQTKIEKLKGKTVAPKKEVIDTVAVSAKEEQEQTPKKDYWWVYATILALAAIAGLLYYYFFYLTMSNG